MAYRNTAEHAEMAVAIAVPGYRFAKAYRSFLESPPLKSKESGGKDLNGWCLNRIRDLCGATSFEEALRNRDIRTLLSFGYLGILQHSPPALPSIRRGMKIPKAAANLEPDFFPTLLSEIKSFETAFPYFRSQLKAAEKELTQLIAGLSENIGKTNTKRSTKGVIAAAGPSGSPGGAEILTGIAAFAIVFIFISTTYKKVT